MQREIEMKQTRRYVNVITLKNIHWQLEQEIYCHHIDMIFLINISGQILL